jgi:hypothetical protein
VGVVYIPGGVQEKLHGTYVFLEFMMSHLTSGAHLVGHVVAS